MLHRVNSSALAALGRALLVVLPIATAATAQQQVAAPPPTKQVPRKPPVPAPPRTVPVPVPEPPYPPIPEAPAVLELGGQPTFKEGDSWTYLVSSEDPRLDGTLLRVTLTKLGSTELVLALEPGGSRPVPVTLAWAGNGWLSPIGAADSTFSMRMFDARGKPGSSDDRQDAASSLKLPMKLESGRQTTISIGGRWEHNFITGVRKQWPGSQLAMTGPEMCVVPAAALACGRFAFVGPETQIVSFFAAEVPVAVRTEYRPMGATGWLLFELHSWESAGTRQSPTFPDLPKAERQKALDWLRPKLAGTPETRSYDAIGGFLALLHEQLRAHPRDLTRITLTPGVTNDQKGYVIEWNKGKFSVREMTADEIAAEPKESMKGTVVHGGVKPLVGRGDVAKTPPAPAATSAASSGARTAPPAPAARAVAPASPAPTAPPVPTVPPVATVRTAPPAPPSPPPLPAVRLVKPPVDGMVWIPPGEMRIGSPPSETGRRDDEMEHVAGTTPGFWIDATEVTNEAFQKFVQQNPEWQREPVRKRYGTTAYLLTWKDAEYPAGKGQHPATFISWHPARAYCAWLNKRLPTEAEWEYAARAGSTTAYWWGQEFNPSGANINQKNTEPVGSALRTNPWGGIDMLGNVREWTSSLFKDYPYRADDGREDSSDERRDRVLRGGSWGHFAREVRSANRYRNEPREATDYIGFRCVRQ